MSEDIYTQPKYHFNKKAAYAFAARFSLYYMNYDKTIEYANAVLGNNPASVLRDFCQYLNLDSTIINEKRCQGLCSPSTCC